MRRFIEMYPLDRPAERHEIELGAAAAVVRKRAGFELALGGAADGGELWLRASEQGMEVRSSGNFVWEGVPHTEATVPWGAEIYLGDLRLGFVKEGKAGTKTSPVVPVALILALLVGGATALQGLLLPSLEAAPLGRPAVELPQVECRASDAQASARAAKQAESLARAKEQRSVFLLREGVEALELYQEAAECFEQAERSEAAKRARGEATRFEKVMAERTSGLQLRLNIALRYDRPEQALEAARTLSSVLEEHDAQGEAEQRYLGWLARTRDELERRVQAK